MTEDEKHQPAPPNDRTNLMICGMTSMTAFQIECLTPSGSGAIATIAVSGPGAWSAVRRLFRPASPHPLPAQPRPGSTWFGTIGEGTGDDVILAVTETDPETLIEIHCHGGRQVVCWLIDLIQHEGGLLSSTIAVDSVESPWALLPHAKTLRTAAILLDQANGAFHRALAQIADALQTQQDSDAEAKLRDLIQYAAIGRHLIEPWRVVIAGAPNAGKSSLLNALAGYQRSIVAPVPGTTRDVVSATLAFDGWLVELSDTAGLRTAGDQLEQEGIVRAKNHIEQADLCLWVIDTTAPLPSSGDQSVGEWEFAADRTIAVLNKTDLPPAWDLSGFTEAASVSSLKGTGLDELAKRMTAFLVSVEPPPNAAVPYSVATCELVIVLLELLGAGNREEAIAAINAWRNPTPSDSER